MPFLNDVSPWYLKVPFSPFSKMTWSPTCGVASTLVVDLVGLGWLVVRRGRVEVDFEVCGCTRAWPVLAALVCAEVLALGWLVLIRRAGIDDGILEDATLIPCQNTC
jgi:hypothetical protein